MVNLGGSWASWAALLALIVFLVSCFALVCRDEWSKHALWTEFWAFRMYLGVTLGVPWGYPGVTLGLPWVRVPCVGPFFCKSNS